MRPDDLLVLTLRFHNVELKGFDLVPQGDEGLLILDFPPQAILEQTFLELSNIPLTDGDPPASPPPPPPLGQTRAAFSGPSRLVFLLRQPIEPTLEAILEACRQPSDLREPIPVAPSPGQTLLDLSPPVSAVELPYGLVLRENDAVSGTWAHTAGSAFNLSSGRVELWHTRLVDAQALALHHLERGVDVRVVWHNPDEPGIDPATLSPGDRRDLERYGRSQDLPPVTTRRLMVSALGGWLDAEGDWTAVTPDPDTSLVYWRQRMTMGRDHYVRVIDEGRLFPFGHPAALVKVSERKVQPDPDGAPVGYLRQQMYLVVRCPHMNYESVFARRRDFPFKSVTLNTLSTPNLRNPTETELVSGGGGRAFWPTVGFDPATSADVQFQVEAVDIDDNVLEFTMPLAFIARGMEGELGDAWMGSTTGFLSDDPRARSRRRRTMGGRCMAFAGRQRDRLDPAAAHATSYEADLLEFAGELDAGGRSTSSPGLDPGASAQPAPFRPFLRRAQARVPAIRELTGSKAAVAFEYHPNFTDATKSVPLDVFALLVEDDGVVPPKMTFTREQAGGLAAPNMVVQSLSTRLGALGPTGAGTRDPGTDLFKPADFFNNQDPLLLGGLELLKILAPHSSVDEMPSVVSTKKGDTSATTLHWETTKLLPVGPFLPNPDPSPSNEPPAGRFSIEVTRTAPKGGQTTLESKGELQHFKLSLVGLVELPFNSVTFHAMTGRKLDLAVDLGAPQFVGQLRFVQTIIDALPLQGFVDPPAVSLTPEGVQVGYSLGIPTVGLGYVTLQNLSLAAAVNLPLLSGSASLTFSFAERHNPFIVTYSALGGGGFFSITLGLHDVEMLEASIEFGGAFALNLGVASGAATLTAGFYYGLINGAYVLSGFVRAAGSLEVLGILSVSAEFYLALTYKVDQHIVIGSATLTVKVKLLFVSKSVELTVQRDFPEPISTRSKAFGLRAATGPLAPENFTFEKTMPEQRLWERYCLAFADE